MGEAERQEAKKKAEAAVANFLKKVTNQNPTKEATMQTATESTLASDLAQFTGTANWYKSFLGLKFTDGVKYLADKAKAYWLVDLVASHQPAVVRKYGPGLQVWTLKKTKLGYTAVADNGNGEHLKSQFFGYTDFPVELFPFKLYVQNGVLMLPSEY